MIRNEQDRVDGDAMSDSTADVLYFASRAEWRSWLEANHATAPEARVAIPKGPGRAGRLTIDDVQEEALCFGWIDGGAAKLDGSHFVVRLTPRRRGSVWSAINVRRVERLAAEGAMTEAGWRVVDEANRNGQWEFALRLEQTDAVPAVLETALRQVPGGLESYMALPNWRRKQVLYSVLSAKSDATRDRRVNAVVQEVSALLDARSSEAAPS